MTDRHILATSGGFRPSDRGLFLWQQGPLIRHALELSGASRPKVCYLGTASGDAMMGTQGFYNAFAGRDDAIPSHASVYPMPNHESLADHLLAQDVIWVGGGSVANLLALWRVHGLDEVMRTAWESGIVLGGVSAGSICWHTGGTTDSFGTKLQAVTNGLGLIPYANGVHYDSEAERRPLLHSLVGEGALGTAYASDDGAGLHYLGTELHEALTDRPGARCYRVERVDGEVVETTLPTRLLS